MRDHDTYAGLWPSWSVETLRAAVLRGCTRRALHADPPGMQSYESHAVLRPCQVTRRAQRWVRGRDLRSRMVGGGAGERPPPVHKIVAELAGMGGQAP